MNDCVIDLIEKKQFLFYWVDAIFVKKEASEHVFEAYRKAGFYYTIKYCDKIEFNRNKKMLMVYPEGKPPKPFPILRNRLVYFKK